MDRVDYRAAGVDIAAGNEAVRRIKKSVESTFSPHVLSNIGGFGALYDLRWLMQHYQHPVMVQSIDGVGTKMMVAKSMQRFDTIGIDLVSATANDIIVLGAKPLTLLDYIANDHLNPHIIEQIIDGMTYACKQAGISLVGGEMAEMPGTYQAGEYDLVGIVTGVVEKERAILGHDIKPGDRLVAFRSSGLHTNGYSLARKLLFEIGGYDVMSQLPTLPDALGDILLMPHVNYTQPILHVLEQGVEIKGMAHITGGGVIENIPRILPRNCAVKIQTQACPIPPIFPILRELGRLDQHEMYRTFNMGIGMVMIISPDQLSPLHEALVKFPQYPLYEIGEVEPGNRLVRLIV